MLKRAKPSQFDELFSKSNFSHFFKELFGTMDAKATTRRSTERES